MPGVVADPKNLIASGAKVLQIEAAALALLSRSLTGSFAQAVAMILTAKGRIIVGGMGKSGHVARKIAATLASTGTPAQFVHPAEASHGDLGMITEDDVVILLSNSGEASELADMIAYCRRFGIDLIGVTSVATSTLAKQSDIAIILPDAPEACPNGLAPTTSTTMTMALGDALAVALMEQRRFTPENYRAFHPGGKLGARLTTVADLMHGGEAMPLVAPNAPMSEALLVISARGFGVAGVIDKAGILVGVITDGDLRRHMANLLEHQAADVMTHEPKTVASGALASEALGIMNALKITTLFAVDGKGKPLGILNVHDCLRAGIG